ncbi:autotransporter outer membrane beta-barrel domain-containing protein [Leminorella grimontii]|uniref:autotransporter outer membrane beta-barrel domain-containing protein n=1 Tax=Leminorella grimontii TaxID=82981 RepID=UPI0021C2645D|nr:autotransporter outer membrane beta-barrel domain-containing protein [Leminorella grimontii]
MNLPTFSRTAVAVWMCLFSAAGNAANVDWKYSESTDWGNQNNWNGGVLPGVSDFVRISEDGDKGPAIDGGAFNIGGLSIGNGGANGALSILNGGELTSGVGYHINYIGNDEGTTGSVTVSGPGSTWNIADGSVLYLGGSGSGSLLIENGASVNLLPSAAPVVGGIYSNIYMGANNPGGTDSLTVTGAGSSLNIASWLLLAYGGNNTFHNTTSIVNVSNGGSITADGIDVGYGGHGIMTISSGGVVTTEHGLVSPYVGSKGELTITGSGSRWTVAQKMTLASQGDATLVINDGGQLIDSSSFAAVASGSNAKMLVSGAGSSWRTANDLSVGYGGDARLTVSNGALLESGLGYASLMADSKSQILVTDAGSRWNNDSLLVVGYYGDAALTIANGAAVSVNGDLYVAAASGSRGVINIGAAQGDAPTAPGTLEAKNLTFGDGDGAVAFNHSDVSGAYLFETAMSGQGRVDAYSGITVMSGQNEYGGETTVYGGEIAASGAQTLSPNSAYAVKSNGRLNLAGYSHTLDSLDNAGAVGLMGIPGGEGNRAFYNAADENAMLTVEHDVKNSGAIYLGDTEGRSRVGNSLIVKGNYQGDDGSLHFNTTLGDDSSPTDTMTVQGNTSGLTYVSVSNAGGSGASTLDGIKLIQVDGQSEGEFVQRGRIAAGAYDYTLGRGLNGKEKNWYLTNAGVRPEGGEYAANLAAANGMFVMRLHDRLGETQYTDALTGEKKVTSLWLRNVGGHNRSRDDSGQLKTQSNRYVVQLGGDVAQWGNDGDSRLHLGLMAGYGRAESRTRSGVLDYRANGTVDGYSAGMYLTWYDNQPDKSGLYVDSWVQYGWFNNTVKGDDAAEESYDSSGVTASVESGYTFKLGERQRGPQNKEQFFIQPKFQAVWMGVGADDHKESNGTRVTGEGKGNLMTRLGVRLYAQGHHEIDNGKNRLFEPFIEANWIHNTKQFGGTMNGVTVYQAGTKNIGELKLGVEGMLNPNFNLWGNVGQQLGDDGYSDTSVVLGVKYLF